MTIRIPAKKAEEKKTILKRNYTRPCVTIARIEQFDNFIRVRRNEALQEYDQGKNVYLTINDSSPENNGICINKAYELDNFFTVLSCFEKANCRHGLQWVTLWIEFSE